MPVIKIPAPYRPYTGGASEYGAPPGTVKSVLEHLLAAYPALKPHLVNRHGQPHPFINIYINDTHIKDLALMETYLRDSDLMRIVPGIAGGNYSAQC